jgi:hypothetical protein
MARRPKRRNRDQRPLTKPANEYLQRGCEHILERDYNRAIVDRSLVDGPVRRLPLPGMA